MSVYDDLRREYAGQRLNESDVDSDPLVLFRTWFEAAVAADIPMANAMTLATVDPDGQPSVRIVLLKGYDPSGFVFFTNYLSRKGAAIAADPRVGLGMWWEPMHRQVRIEGRAVRVEAGESDAYFTERPRASNISGMASPQSEVIEGRGALEALAQKTRETWHGRDLQRPPFWGGYRVEPGEIEFWQGQPDRLHDRLRYRRDGDSWRLDRLAP